MTKAPPSRKQRADVLLVERGLAETRHKAQALIMAGVVRSAGTRVEKPGQPLPADAALDVEKPLPFVGRGGLKLAEALDVFRLDVRGRLCADIGSSTGGFTDCLLQRGAARVIAVDVDIRQLDARLRADPRVTTLEKNARLLAPGDFAEPPALAVMDVSFISVTKILPALGPLLNPAGADILSLIKPQFEAGRSQVGKKGVVRDPAVHAATLLRVADEAARLGFALRGVSRSATRGQKGNQEFFFRLAPGGVEPPREDVLQWIEEAARHETD